jgi:hypothetical protein
MTQKLSLNVGGIDARAGGKTVVAASRGTPAGRGFPLRAKSPAIAGRMGMVPSSSSSIEPPGTRVPAAAEPTHPRSRGNPGCRQRQPLAADPGHRLVIQHRLADGHGPNPGTGHTHYKLTPIGS